MRRVRLGTVLGVVLALLVPLAAVLTGLWASDRIVAWLSRPPSGRASHPVTFEVQRGQGASAIARQLESLGLVSDARAFRLWLQLTGQSDRLQAGEYRADEPMSPSELARMLVEGRVLLHAFTVPEGLSLWETARLLAAAGWWEVVELEAAFRDPAPIRAIDPEAEDLEGYLFPETYHHARGTSASDVARAMVDRFVEVWKRADGEARSAELGLSVRDVATIASLVEEETPLPQEHRLISSVWHNRLERGMRMECDPTVIYALQRDGLWTGGPLLLAHLQHDSPYNTYRYPGLPPGPIASFGEAALRAALNPADSKLLFFVASGGGGHRFAETMQDHLRNVARWRRVQQQSRQSGGP